MKQQIILAGGGKDYEWSSDHIFVKSTPDISDGRVTLVEDTLKPGFHLARHYHKQMVEIFYILEGQVTFHFDDETIIAEVGIAVNIPPMVWHEVTCEAEARLLTIFTPGGFDDYLTALQNLSAEELAYETLMQELAERYDSWMR